MSHRKSAFSHDFIQVGFVFVLCQLSPEFQLVDQNPLHRLIEMEMFLPSAVECKLFQECSWVLRLFKTHTFKIIFLALFLTDSQNKTSIQKDDWCLGLDPAKHRSVGLSLHVQIVPCTPVVVRHGKCRNALLDHGQSAESFAKPNNTEALRMEDWYEILFCVIPQDLGYRFYYLFKKILFHSVSLHWRQAKTYTCCTVCRRSFADQSRPTSSGTMLGK